MKDHKKIKKQIILSIFFSMLVFFFVMANLININTKSKFNLNIPQKGILDLRAFNIKDEIIDLDGEWEFYPNVLLDPEDMKDLEFKGVEKSYILVPGSWEKYLENQDSVEGSGTYRLRIKVGEDGVYAIKTNTIRMASRIYINGHEVARTGKTTLFRKDFKPESKYRLASGNSKDNEMDIVIQVSSFGHKSGGIIKSIKFSTFENILRNNNQTRALEALSISGALTLSMYFLIIYIQRNKEPYLLYFSLLNIIVAIYLSTMNEQLLDLIFDYDFSARIKLQVICMILNSICLLKFTYHFSQDYSNKRIINIFTYTNVLILFLAFLNIEKLSRTVTGFIQIIIVFSYMVSFTVLFYTLLKAIYKGYDSLIYIFMTITTLALYWVLIGLKVIFEINLGNIQTGLILLTLAANAALMTNRLQRDYKDAKSLSEKLLIYDIQKDEFLAKVSHELRTPLHIILNLSNNLLEGRKGTLNLSQQEDILFIYQEGRRLTNLVTDLLDASQIKEGDLRLNIKAIDIYLLVEEILKEMNIFIPDYKSIVLKNLIPKEFPRVRADGDRLRQIIYNLVHNGIKYTENGEVTVHGTILSNKVKISVVDTGIGIKEENFNNIFEVFFQESKGERENGSLGLGLSIVKHLIEIQGGTIDIQSAYDEGSNFSFTLPIWQYDIEDSKDDIFISKVNKEPEQRHDGIIRKADNKTILIVDDEPLNQKVLKDILNPYGYNIILADSGAEALEKIDNEIIDLVILDFMLPDILGDQVCKEIRKNYSTLELPILILTASGRIMDLKKGFDYGANDFIRKPVVAEEIISRIQSLLMMKDTVEEGLKKQFQYFYSQISPHFLYNTINTIIGISYKDDKKTREALYNLSTYFRGKLDIHREEGLVSLESELELVRAYLEIEALRYGEKLNIIYDIDDSLEAMIPPLTIQPIVENAINHGISSRTKGTIKLSVNRYEDKYIRISIEDNGVGMSAEKQEEILKGNNNRLGFKNIVNKISILKGAKINVFSILDEGTKVEIIIPRSGLQ